MSQPNHEIIAAQNDRFRQGDAAIPGTVVITTELQAVLEETSTSPQELIAAVRADTLFIEDNDPHKEHDFASFSIADTPCYWKIDLYNLTMDGYSDDPTNPAKTHRVLTIMRTVDY